MAAPDKCQSIFLNYDRHALVDDCIGNVGPVQFGWCTVPAVPVCPTGHIWSLSLTNNYRRPCVHRYSCSGRPLGQLILKRPLRSSNIGRNADAEKLKRRRITP